MRTELYGRAAELDAVCASFDSVRAGSSATFAFIGEPGIGKSRLADEVAQRARGAGFACCWGRAWEAGGAPAYFPWRSLLDEMPGLAMRWSTGAAVATDPEQARFELFDEVATRLRAACRARPLLCILDDLHAADLPSLELAAFVTRHLRSQPILWIATWRDVEAATSPGKDLIAAIARSAQTLPLARLSAEDTRRVLDELAATRERSVDDMVYRATAGNPLFILETLACMAKRGPTPLASELALLPMAEGVGAVVRARMALLSPAARRALEAASLLGRDVALDAWTDAADLAAEQLRERAAEIVTTGVLEITAAAHWRFCHDLVREAISRDVPSDFRRAAHRRVASALDHRIGAGERGLAEARLHHGLAAIGAIEPSVVVGWAADASDEARAECAYEQALALVQRAAAVLGPRFATDPRLQLALGRAHLDLGNVSAARDALQAAIDMTRASGDAHTRALSVLAFGSRYVLGNIHDDLVRMIDEASTALGDGERDLRARLLARKAAALTPAERPEQVLGWAREALRMVADSSDDVARLDVCVGVGAAFGDFAHPRERLPVSEELVRLARINKDRALELRGLSRLVTDHIALGELRRADMLLPERDELACMLGSRFVWMTPLFRSMRAMMEGRFDVCRAAVAEAELCGDISGDANATRCIACHRTWLLLLRDDVEGLLAHEPAMLEAVRSMPPILPQAVRAAIRLRSGQHAAARDEVAAIATSLPHCAVMTAVTLAEVVAEVGPRALGRALIDHLTPHADTLAIFGPFALVCGVPVATALGSLEAAFGDPARARQYFTAALEGTTTSHSRALRAWTRYVYGRALVGPLAEAEQGRALLEAAADEAAALDMGRLPARCRELLATKLALATDPGAWTMREEASGWRFERAGRSMLLPRMRGMPMLARLVGSPDTEVHSLELVTGTPATARDAGDAGEHLDESSRAAYRRRAAELAERIEDAAARGDADRADDARSELDALRRELSRAIGRGGRTRKASAAAERARVSAQRRIREAIKRLRDVDAELADHLDHTVQTGVYCVYARHRKRA